MKEKCHLAFLTVFLLTLWLPALAKERKHIDFYNINAWPDSVSVTEMKSQFYEFIERHDTALDDRFHRILEAGLDGTYLNNRHLFIERNSYKKDSLPPSVFLNYQNAVRPECVYWMRWRDTTTVKDVTKQKKLLERANDVFSVHDTVKLIPAKWISGQYFTLKYPFHYGTTIVSKQPVLYQIKKGVRKDVRFIRLGDSELSSTVSRLRKAYFYGNPDLGIERKDGKEISHEEWMKKEERESLASLTLFARDVMRLCREEREAPRSEFSLLFHYDSQRRLHVDVLLPKELNEEEQRRIDELQRAVALQPPGLFSSFFTIDGRVFPGMYVKATYERGRWRFEDYRFLSLKG